MISFKASVLLFALLYISYSHDPSQHHKCEHHKIQDAPGFLDVDEDMSAFSEEGRLLQSTSYPNLRIYPYYDFLASSGASSTFIAYVQTQLMPPIISYFQSALRVKAPVVGNLVLGSTVTTICEKSTPSILKSGGVAADFFFYVDSYADSSSQIANAKYCFLAATTKRPIVGRIQVNRNMLPVTGTSAIVNERNMYVLIHELMHAFGFSQYTFPYFIDNNGVTRTGHIKTMSIAGATRQVLDVPPLTDKLRAHFGCSTLPGAIMEDDGGYDTSHFERKHFLYEVMTSGSIFGMRVSQFSLALLEGSGWYVPDYSYAEPFFYGQGQGCTLISGTCPSSGTQPFEEFCSGTQTGCSIHGRGGGNCWSIDSYSDGCKYYFPYEQYDCDNDNYSGRLTNLQVYGRGKNSKCFSGNLYTSSTSNAQTAFCFPYKCQGTGTSTNVQVQIGGNWFTCYSKGPMSVSGYSGQVDCPDPLSFCSTVGVQYCPLNCMGRGTCVSNKCVCNTGFTGIDCALKA